MTDPSDTHKSAGKQDASHEEERQRVLQDLDLLDTPESESFDRITRMASRLFRTPVAAISLSDNNRQWFKSYVGTGGREIPREAAPCAEVTRSQAMLIVPDMLLDARFADSLLAQSGARFYAGAPLRTRTGHVLGSICVLDQNPRTILDHEVASLQDFAAMVMAQIELEHDFGRIDPRSGLANYNQLADDLSDLERLDADARRAAILIDVADADQYNEALSVLGAEYVDDLVKNASRRIRTLLPRKTRLYHVRNSSFVFLLDELTNEAWRDIVMSIAELFTAPIQCAGIPVVANPTFGISPFLLSEAAPSDVLRTALTAAHDARKANLPYAVYSPANDEANRRRFALLNDMREALIGNDQLFLVYQPRVDLRTGVCTGAEALLRWNHPAFGSVPPGEFIPLIEQTALAHTLTRWVLQKALEQAAAWREASIDIRISINISARNLEEESFALDLSQLLENCALKPSAIELEFTESALIRNRSRVLGQLEQIRDLGVALAIDDFGTGYSTFSYLHKLPATTMKIDQSFIRTLTANSTEETLVRSMISMAHNIGYRVVAEGVETGEIYKFLEKAGCDEVQGFYLAPPLPIGQFEEWLKLGKQKRTRATVSGGE